MRPDSLPQGWGSATLPDVLTGEGLISDGDWVETKDQDPTGDVRLIQLADIGDGEFRNRSNRFLTKAKAEELGCTYLRAGDLLVARMPDPLGRACIFPDLGQRCVTAVDVCIVRPGSRSVSPRWLMYTLNSPEIRLAISRHQSGSTRKRVSKSNLTTIAFPVAPLPEQRRIVEAIESYFTRLDVAIVTLERVTANLKRYRASVLKAAVEGRLVPTEAELARKEGRDYQPASVLLERILRERRRRWEDAELAKLKAKDEVPKDEGWKRKYQAPIAPDISNLPELPEGWAWTTVDQLVIEPLSNGRSVPTADAGFPVLRLTALGDGRIDLSQRKIGAWTEGEAAGYVVRRGDFLVARGNGSLRLVGRGGLVESEPDPVAYPDTLIRLRLSDGFVPRLFAQVWNSTLVRLQIERTARTTAGIYKVNQTDLSRVIVPLPPRAEQLRILESLEEALSVTKAAETIAGASVVRSRRLKQAILKWAFEGNLVDQDPADEPASVLLERIERERENGQMARQNKPGGSRKRKTA